MSADLIQPLFAGTALIFVAVGSVHAEFMYMERKFDGKLKELKDEHDREHKRFKDALRLQAQATMNPPRAHFMFADQRPVDDVLNDKEYKSEARVRDRSWWQWLRGS